MLHLMMREMLRVSSDAVPTFEELARAPDDRIDVALGAALVAKDEYPQLDVRAMLHRFDDLASPLLDARLEALPAIYQAEAVSEHFRQLGFRGNSDDYFDPRNSLLPDVLDRRLGIPITLSLVWCEIAQRAGVFARGLGFPGHFLVRVDARPHARRARPRGLVVVDAYAGGRVLTDEDAVELAQRSIARRSESPEQLFAPVTPRAFLVRLLTNLKAVHDNRGDLARMFVVVDRIATLMPDSARALRERANVSVRVGAAEIARADLERLRQLDPGAPDLKRLEMQLGQLSRRVRAVS